MCFSGEKPYISSDSPSKFSRPPYPFHIHKRVIMTSNEIIVFMKGFAHSAQMLIGSIIPPKIKNLFMRGNDNPYLRDKFLLLMFIHELLKTKSHFG